LDEDEDNDSSDEESSELSLEGDSEKSD